MQLQCRNTLSVPREPGIDTDDQIATTLIPVAEQLLMVRLLSLSVLVGEMMRMCRTGEE